MTQKDSLCQYFATTLVVLSIATLTMGRFPKTTLSDTLETL
jgi:hypothetical protein